MVFIMVLWLRLHLHLQPVLNIHGAGAKRIEVLSSRSLRITIVQIWKTVPSPIRLIMGVRNGKLTG